MASYSLREETDDQKRQKNFFAELQMLLNASSQTQVLRCFSTRANLFNHI